MYWASRFEASRGGSNACEGRVGDQQHRPHAERPRKTYAGGRAPAGNSEPSRRRLKAVSSIGSHDDRIPRQRWQHTSRGMILKQTTEFTVSGRCRSLHTQETMAKPVPTTIHRRGEQHTPRWATPDQQRPHRRSSSSSRICARRTSRSEQRVPPGSGNTERRWQTGCVKTEEAATTRTWTS